MSTSIVLSIISAAIALFAFSFSIYTYLMSIKRDQRRATIDAFNRLQEQAFDPLNLYMPKEIAEYAKHPTDKQYKIISGYVARIEHFCVGVIDKTYDRKTVYELAHGYLDGNALRRRISPIIEAKNNDCNKEDFYENIPKTMTWMEKTTKKKHRASKKTYKKGI